ncbi:hypothetical protein EON63_25220 [archaeon]|nr:MAG: hypothetical protein EON63_25220 [archaeon]
MPPGTNTHQCGYGYDYGEGYGYGHGYVFYKFWCEHVNESPLCVCIIDTHSMQEIVRSHIGAAVGMGDQVKFGKWRGLGGVVR